MAKPTRRQTFSEIVSAAQHDSIDRQNKSVDNIAETQPKKADKKGKPSLPR